MISKTRNVPTLNRSERVMYIAITSSLEELPSTAMVSLVSL